MMHSRLEEAHREHSKAMPVLRSSVSATAPTCMFQTRVPRPAHHLFGSEFCQGATLGTLSELAPPTECAASFHSYGLDCSGPLVKYGFALQVRTLQGINPTHGWIPRVNAWASPERTGSTTPGCPVPSRPSSTKRLPNSEALVNPMSDNPCRQKPVSRKQAAKPVARGVLVMH